MFGPIDVQAAMADADGREELLLTLSTSDRRGPSQTGGGGDGAVVAGRGGGLAGGRRGGQGHRTRRPRPQRSPPLQVGRFGLESKQKFTSQSVL